MVETWAGCYDARWNDLIVPEAFAHPAKMARGLVARIFDALIADGMLERGDLVVDPFGGIGTTAIEGASRGVQVVCCELEPKFVALALDNFALHRRDWQTMGRPLPIVVLGDSRQLRHRLGPVLAECVVTSPPHTPAALGHTKSHHATVMLSPAEARLRNPRRSNLPEYGDSPGQLGAMSNGSVEAVISSPPYAEISSGAGGLNTKPPKHAGQQGGRSASSASQDTDQRYGDSTGQLARMPLGAVDALVSSPPYAGNDKADNTLQDRDPRADRFTGAFRGSYSRSDGQLGAMQSGSVDAVVSSPPFTQGYAGGGGINVKGYGPDGADKVGSRTYQGTGNDRLDGNLETLTLGDVAAVVTSPPYMGEAVRPSGIDGFKFGPDVKRGGPNSQIHAVGYGDSEGQLGGLRSEETFWSAAKQVVAESFAILRPGGTAVWVVKAFVRDKQLVDFPGDWRRLCEHVGFETSREVHASLVHEEVRSHLFDGEVVKRRERKSFFRRLAEKKGSPRIDFEVVLFMRKPEASA